MACSEGPEKYYLYEIVSNKLTGVDVDKVNKVTRLPLTLPIMHHFQWDYFLRDSRACDLNILFKYERLVSNMKIVDWLYEEYGQLMKEPCKKLYNCKKILCRQNCQTDCLQG